LIYVEIEDTKDNRVVFKGTNKDAIKFLDVSLSTLSNAVSNQRLIRKRYKIIVYQSINNKIDQAVLKNIFNDYCEGFTLSQLQAKYGYNTIVILENLQSIPTFDSRYSHYSIDSYLKDKIKEMYTSYDIATICKELRVTRKQVDAVINEKPILLFEKVSKANILKRAFNQINDPSIVYKRIMNTNRFGLWNTDEDELKRDVYEYFEREINQFL